MRSGVGGRCLCVGEGGEGGEGGGGVESKRRNAVEMERVVSSLVTATAAEKIPFLW